MNAGRWIARGLLVLLAAVCAIPLFWLILAPSKDSAELANLHPLAFGNIGGYASAWANLASYQDGIIYRWFANTVLYSAAIIVLAVSSSLAAGYALAATRIRARRLILLVTLIAMIIPSAALVLPLFLTLNTVRLIDTPWAFILPASLFPFGVYLAFLHFSTAIPRPLLEAARIDGASEWSIFARIALPLSKSLMGLLTFFAFVGAWNNYFLPFVVLSDQDNFTLQLGLQFLMESGAVTNPGTVTNLPIHAPEAAIASLATVLPVAIVFLFCQQYLARGIIGGAIKD